MALCAIDVYDKTHTARIMFKKGIVQRILMKIRLVPKLRALLFLPNSLIHIHIPRISNNAWRLFLYLLSTKKKGTRNVLTAPEGAARTLRCARTGRRRHFIVAA
jgi:hypothetical protein